MTLLYVLLAALAATAFFLGSRHHRLNLRIRPAGCRAVGSALLMSAWAVGWGTLGMWAGAFAVLSAFMLTAVALPYLHAVWRGEGGRPHHVG